MPGEMRLGFSGTRYGMTEAQMRAFVAYVLSHRPIEFHHGDCIGADAEAHAAVLSLIILPPIDIVLHPPIDPSKRAFCSGTSRVLPPARYVVRNHSIVDMTDELVATPRLAEAAEPRSGTWATTRYARKVGKPITTIWPDGQIEQATS